MDYKQLIDNLKDNDIFNLLEKLGAEPLDKGDYFLCKTMPLFIYCIKPSL